jgi:hypothetical protein
LVFPAALFIHSVNKRRALESEEDTWLVTELLEPKNARWGNRDAHSFAIDPHVDGTSQQCTSSKSGLWIQPWSTRPETHRWDTAHELRKPNQTGTLDQVAKWLGCATCLTSRIT